MIRINDPEYALAGLVEDQIYYENDNGECAIDRISSHQFMAIVMNNNCELSRIMSESGCFITSAIAEGDDICWTIVGPNSTYVKNLIDRLNMEGFTTRRKSSFSTDYAALLSERQEEALRTALSEGFYEIPRKTKMDDLCKILNCSKSTLDVTLRTAERKIITHYILQNRETVINRKK